MGSVGAVVNMPWIDKSARSSIYLSRIMVHYAKFVFVGVYSSSKAALINLSETLRLELTPFDISVVTIVAGVVDSKFHINDGDGNFTLPPNSCYTPIKDIIASWASGAAKPKGCSAEVFVETLVDIIVGDSKTKSIVLRGPHASMIKFMISWFPGFMLVSKLWKLPLFYPFFSIY
jgi:NAD(P)-dependent dehydrogenase (short-subunit alcohol dehydrogenase family)